MTPPDSSKPSMYWMYHGKLSAVCSKDDMRPSLQAAWLRPLDKEGQWMMQATNSYVMAWLPVTVENDAMLRKRAENQQAIYFPPRALIELEKRRGQYAIFEPNGSVSIEDVTFHIPRNLVRWTDEREQAGGHHPVQPKAIPPPSSLQQDVKNRFEFAFNVDFLRAAANALEAREVKVTLDLDNPEHQIFISPLRLDGGGEAILMPVRLAI